MNATGLTAEEIYANYDSNYVLQYDTLGLGNPDFANGVLQYVGKGPIVISYFDENGGVTHEDTYFLDRA